MRVSLGTIEVSDQERRGVRLRDGESGLATRKEIRDYALNAVLGALQELGDAEGDWEGLQESAAYGEWGERVGAWKGGEFSPDEDDNPPEDDDDGELY